LPCKDLASGPKIGELHAPHNSVPLFEQIWPPRIKQDAKIQIQRVSGQHISHQLIRHIVLAFPWQHGTLKHFIQIAILFDYSGMLDLEISLS
jgi:hypothetical protein